MKKLIPAEAEKSSPTKRQYGAGKSVVFRSGVHVPEFGKRYATDKVDDEQVLVSLQKKSIVILDDILCGKKFGDSRIEVAKFVLGRTLWKNPETYSPTQIVNVFSAERITEAKRKAGLLEAKVLSQKVNPAERLEESPLGLHETEHEES